MDLRQIAWLGVDWIHLAQERDQWLFDYLSNCQLLNKESGPLS